MSAVIETLLNVLVLCTGNPARSSLSWKIKPDTVREL
jgi:protein-tyrosine-phosphatase